MSTASPLDDFESRYLGEPAPRRSWVAFALALLAPGLGQVYLGRLGAGLALQAIGLSFVVGYIVALSAVGFVPQLPGLVAALGGGWLLLMVAVDAAIDAARLGDDYVRRDVNHPLVYAAVALFAWWGPMLGLQQLASNAIYRVVEITDDGMEPTLLAGDRVRVDVRAYRGGMPLRSDVVVYRDPMHEGRLDVGRVIARPGEELVLVEGMPYVDDTPLAQGRPSAVALDALEQVVGPIADEDPILLEDSGTRRYPIAVPVVAWWGDPTRRDVPEDAVFVMNDRRGRIDDSREAGSIPLDAIVGRVDHVAWSSTSDSALDRMPGGLRGAWLGAAALVGGDEVRDHRTGRRIHTRPR